jgi:hypothetical protein
MSSGRGTVVVAHVSHGTERPKSVALDNSRHKENKEDVDGSPSNSTPRAKKTKLSSKDTRSSGRKEVAREPSDRKPDTTLQVKDSREGRRERSKSTKERSDRLEDNSSSSRKRLHKDREGGTKESPSGRASRDSRSGVEIDVLSPGRKKEPEEKGERKKTDKRSTSSKHRDSRRLLKLDSPKSDVSEKDQPENSEKSDNTEPVNTSNTSSASPASTASTESAASTINTSLTTNEIVSAPHPETAENPSEGSSPDSLKKSMTSSSECIQKSKREKVTRVFSQEVAVPSLASSGKERKLTRSASLKIDGSRTSPRGQSGFVRPQRLSRIATVADEECFPELEILEKELSEADKELAALMAKLKKREHSLATFEVCFFLKFIFFALHGIIKVLVV